MNRRGLGRLLGLGAAACAACCVGPILAALAAVGAFTAIGVAVFGMVGLAVATLAIPIVARRRRRTVCDLPPDVPARVALGRARTDG